MTDIQTFRNQMWLVETTCECDYCQSWVQSTLVECVVFGDGKCQQTVVKCGHHVSVITVENWSM